MLYRSISVAIILLLSWFAYSSMQTMQRLNLKVSTIKQIVTENVEYSGAVNLELNNKIDQIQAYIVKQKQLSAEKKQVESTLASQKKLRRFQATYSRVLKAEILRSNNKLSDAAALLKSTKKDIWKAGDTYRDKQKTLRSLMPKIDALVNAWNKGDNEMTAKPVYAALDQIIQEKGK